MNNDVERKGFFDRLFASGKEALSAKNIVIRLVLMFVFGIVLNGWRGLIVSLNEFGWQGIFKSYWAGVTKSLSSVWFGFVNFDSLSSLGGSKVALFFILFGLVLALSPFVRTFLDIFDFQKGEALGFVMITLVTLILIAILGLVAFKAGVAPELLGVDYEGVADDGLVADSSDVLVNDSVVNSSVAPESPDLVATINLLSGGV